MAGRAAWQFVLVEGRGPAQEAGLLRVKKKVRPRIGYMPESGLAGAAGRLRQ
ncbi:hypothetical protein D3C85_1881070 [compost metagenome]